MWWWVSPFLASWAAGWLVHDASRSRVLYYALGAVLGVLGGFALLAWWLPDRLRPSVAGLAAIVHALALGGGSWWTMSAAADASPWLNYVVVYVVLAAWLGVAVVHLTMKRYTEAVHEAAGLVHGTLLVSAVLGVWVLTRNDVRITAVCAGAMLGAGLVRRVPCSMSFPCCKRNAEATDADDDECASDPGTAGVPDPPANETFIKRMTLAEYVADRVVGTRQHTDALFATPAFQAWFLANHHRLSVPVASPQAVD